MKPRSAEHENRNPENDNKNTVVERRIANWTRILGWATIILAVGTGLLAYFGWQAVRDNRKFAGDQIARMDSQIKEQRGFDSGQLASMRTQIEDSRKFALAQDTFSRATLDSTGKQIGIAREAMQKELRPYVGLKKFIYNATGDIDSLVFGNVGRTPAYNLAFKAHDTLAPYPTHKLNPLSTSSSLSAITMSPGSEGSLPLRGRPKLWELDSIKSGRMAFYRWAIVTYSDIFGIEHFTKVRIAERFANGHPDYIIPKEGNEYDKN